MGRQALPSIAKLEDALDLLTNTAKYQKYLQELKAIYNDVALKLADLATKEQADNYLAQAHTKLLDISAKVDQAEAEYQDSKVAKAEAKEARAAAQAYEAATASRLTEVNAQFAVIEKEKARLAHERQEFQAYIEHEKAELQKVRQGHAEAMHELETKRKRLSTALAEI